MAAALCCAGCGLFRGAGAVRALQSSPSPALSPAASASSGCSPGQPSVEPAVREPSEETRKGIQRILSRSIESDEIPGIVVSIDRSGWRWSAAAGKASIRPGIKALPDMKFRAASISKTFTAAAILKLYEEGRLKLDESPLRYLHGRLADAPALSKITIRMLLTHRSGLADLDAAALMGEQRSKGSDPITAEDAAGRALSKGLMFTPGSSWAYSNAGYVILSMVIDGASQTGYEDYLHQMLIGPLNLAGTETPTKPPSKEIAGPHMNCICRLKDGAWADTTETYFNWNRGGGDLISTTGDLNRFHRALRNGRILRRETFEVMRRFSPIPLPIPELAAAGYESGYGCGYGRFRIGTPKMTLEGHVGGYSGAVSSMVYWVEGDTYISINSNGRYSPGYEMALIIPMIQLLGSRAD